MGHFDVAGKDRVADGRPGCKPPVQASEERALLAAELGAVGIRTRDVVAERCLAVAGTLVQVL